MIGVQALEAERRVIAEFFELFKTPWEFYHPGTPYDLVICSSRNIEQNSARLIVLYGSEATHFDDETGGKLGSHSNVQLSYFGNLIPIYGRCLSFAGEANPLRIANGGGSAAREIQSEPQTIVRIGYDLFQEVEHLLQTGQPAVFGQSPTLELHIDYLRNLIVGHGITLFEIPPTPYGYNFTVCLTHDVDHFGIQNHCCDHTMFGFLGRAVFGSAVDLLLGKKAVRHLAANWWAALSLPGVYLGIQKDFWQQLDRYVEIEKGLRSTFFILPQSDNPGRRVVGRGSKRRGAKYNLSQLRDQLLTLRQAGCEIGLHGIDAWVDEEKGRQELERIQDEISGPEVGVRMHWLYLDETSPQLLEKAGFSYDSTVGYNEIVGYRAGTTQVFKPLNVGRLLELPMHVMDTALFYPAYMNLSPNEPSAIVDELVTNTQRFGGVLTVNWHDRSIAPERLWNGFYSGLLDNLRKRRAWFATAGDAIAWFRKRRETVFESVSAEAGAAQLRVAPNPKNRALPGLKLRVCKPPSHSTNRAAGDQSKNQILDFPLEKPGLVNMTI
jgi:hypothetical protein